MKDFHDYSDIINMSRPKSNHPKMARLDRAAQFASFAALSGHSDAIKETARLTDKKIILADNEIEILNFKLCNILDSEKPRPSALFTHFVKDKTKDGGAYIETEGIIKKLDEIRNVVIFEDSTEIAVHDIIDIDILD